jgi:hypothetical protein
VPPAFLPQMPEMWKWAEVRHTQHMTHSESQSKTPDAASFIILV